MFCDGLPSRHIALNRIPPSPPFPFPIEKVGEVEVERWGEREGGRKLIWGNGKKESVQLLEEADRDSLGYREAILKLFTRKQ